MRELVACPQGVTGRRAQQYPGRTIGLLRRQFHLCSPLPLRCVHIGLPRRYSSGGHAEGASRCLYGFRITLGGIPVGWMIRRFYRMMNQLVDRPSPISSHPLSLPLAPVPDSGHIFDVTRRLGTVDMDENQNLRIDGIARHLQDAGVDHLIHMDALDTHPHWIVRRTVIDVLQPITWPAQLRIRRWCSGISPRWCTMRARIDSDTGGLIETEGFWIHMNKDTMSPSRVADEFFDLMCTTTADHRLRWRQWLDTPHPPPPHPVPLTPHRHRPLPTHHQHRLLARHPRIHRRRNRTHPIPPPLRPGVQQAHPLRRTPRHPHHPQHRHPHPLVLRR
ncbi:hypothetical protein GL305_15020, partial [Nocardia seriolae]|nr:hypothetical protein [Nocardia seriolae]